MSFHESLNMVPCRKCPYFDKKISDVSGQSGIIVGFCRLRNKFITDQSINNEYCKDKDIIDISIKDFDEKQRLADERRERNPEAGIVTF